MTKTRTAEATSSDIAYVAALERARDSIPFYRDAWVRDGDLAGRSSVLREDEAADVRFLLWPLGADIGQTISQAVTADRRTLVDALTTCHYLCREDLIFEARSAVVDWSSVGSHPYRVVMAAPDVPLSPGLRQRVSEHVEELFTCRSGVLVTHRDPRPDIVGSRGLPPTTRWIRRVEWNVVAHTPVDGPAVLHSELVGYIGAWSTPCCHWHLAAGIDARVVEDGVELSDLIHTEPTVLRFRPSVQPPVRVLTCGTRAALVVDHD